MGTKSPVLFVISCILVTGFFTACGRPNEPSEGLHTPLLRTRGTLTGARAGEAELNAAVLAVGGLSATGVQHSYVCELARNHADDMAAKKHMSHEGKDHRFRLLVAKGAKGDAQKGTSACGEIVAYAQDAAGCAKGWKGSYGHWELMKIKWDNFCYASAKGADGNLYCIGLFANGLPKSGPKYSPRKNTGTRSVPRSSGPADRIEPTPLPGSRSRSELD